MSESANAAAFPFVVAICPTYGRPHLAANAAACFLAQSYPEERRRLLILDDAGQLAEQRVNDADGAPETSTRTRSSPASIVVMSQATRFCSITRKYNALARRAIWIDRAEIVVVWEDDEIYLPRHISSHVDAIQRTGRLWSKPSEVLTDYPGSIVRENAAGRFHASLAITRAGLERVDWWPETRRADFDQILMSRLQSLAGPAADPLEGYRALCVPQYVFRWHSGSYHGQGYMDGPDDIDWWDRIPVPPGVGVTGGAGRRIELVPKMDDATERVYRSMGYAISAQFTTCSRTAGSRMESERGSG